MGPQTSENILSQLNWDPRGTCLTLTTDDCLKDVNYSVALITHCAFYMYSHECLPELISYLYSRQKVWVTS